MVVKRQEVQWLTRHTLDPLGEVFKWNNRLFRIIYEERKEYVKELFDKGIMNEMINKKFFVNTWINEFIQIEGEENSLILEHELIFHLSLRHEWSYNMFISLRTMVAKFNVWLLEHGYELLDCHYGNVSFVGCHPVYLDLGSIVPSTSCGLEGWNTFKDKWVDRLKLMEKQRIDDKLFRMLNLTGTGLSMADLSRLTGSKGIIKLKTESAKVRDTIEYRIYDNSEESPRKLVQVASNMCRKFLSVDDEKIRDHKINQYEQYGQFRQIQCQNGMWSNYSNNYVDGESVRGDERFNFYVSLVKVLKEKDNIKTSFEIAGNSGIVSQLLLENGILDYACVSDYDLNAIDKGFLRCKDNEKINSRITFAVMDIMTLIEDTGNLACERYKSDLVMALAVTHHLLLTQKVKLSVIVEILRKYTNKYVIVEFMPLGLWAGDDEKCPPIPGWYTLEWFINGIKEKFEVLKVEQISRNRICILGKIL